MDTVYYLETYEEGAQSRIYTLDADGNYVLVYDSADFEEIEGYDFDTLIAQQDGTNINCAAITGDNPVRVAGAFVCTTCGRTQYVWLKAMHTHPDDWTGEGDEDDPYYTPATCTEYGYWEYGCADCGETIVEIDTAGGAPEGHKFGVDTGDVDSDGNPVISLEARKVVLGKGGSRGHRVHGGLRRSPGRGLRHRGRTVCRRGRRGLDRHG